MKKIIIFLFCIMILMLSIKTTDKEYKIENESIRFRIIASSNSVNDQVLKLKIKEEITPILKDIENNSKDIEDARNLIKEDIPKIKEIINKYNIDYDVNYGNNYFPNKLFKGITYDSGNYESLVIQLGDSKGDNWWCILFPPLCMLEIEKEDIDDIDYQFYFKKIIDKY